MKIKKILNNLLRLHPKSIDLSLYRIQRLLKSLNNPEKKLQNCIQVVGTNGKFSICSTLREIYETAGYKVNIHIALLLENLTNDTISLVNKSMMIDYINF